MQYLHNKIYLITLATAIVFCIIIAILSWVYHKIATLKIQLGFTTETNVEVTKNNQLLQQEKITYLQKIEQLTSKIEYQEQLIAQSNQARQESFSSAKAALFDLGGALSKQLIELHKRETQEVRELSEKNIAAATGKFNCEFERLVNMISSLNKDVEQSKGTVDIIKQSLLSPSGAGLLAEITLENILKSSGLRADLDYVIQYSMTTLENAKLRPDAVIFLPSGNLMIIDAKASKFLVEDTDGTNLSRTMNTHLKSLTSKDYAENILASLHKKEQSFSNIITLMFLPTEQAVEKILAADNNFLQKAWKSNIFPVGPAGLINMLSFAKFQISDYRRSENHKLIIDEVRKLLSSVATMADHSQRLGNNIQQIVSNYDKFAGSFNRHFLSRAKKIQKLGIDTGNKAIQIALERYQLVASKSEIIDVETADAASDELTSIEELE